MASVVGGGSLPHHWLVPVQLPELALRFTVGMMILVLNAADVVTTGMMIERGGTEANPVARWFLENGTLGPAKVLTAGVVAVFLLVAPQREWIPRALAVVLGAYVAVVAAHLVQLSTV